MRGKCSNIYLHITRLNSVKCMCRFQARTWISNAICRDLFVFNCLKWGSNKCSSWWHSRYCSPRILKPCPIVLLPNTKRSKEMTRFDCHVSHVTNLWNTKNDKGFNLYVFYFHIAEMTLVYIISRNSICNVWILTRRVWWYQKW